MNAANSNGTHVVNWSVPDVCDWLDLINLGVYKPVFINHGVDGLCLLDTREEDLKQILSIDKLGDLKKLCRHIRQLADSCNFEPRLPPCSGACNNTLHSTLKSSASGTDTCFIDSSTSSHTFAKAIVSFAYCFLVFFFTSLVLVIVHNRTPDMEKYPPLPDMFLENVPFVSWGFQAAEVCAMLLSSTLVIILLCHKNRLVILRRLFSLLGTVFLLRCVTMLLTSISVPNIEHTHCQRKIDGDFWSLAKRAFHIWINLGMSLHGVRTCGDYMYSGHTCMLTLANLFINEYSPRGWHYVHTASWLVNFFGIFFILAAHEHYAIDVFIAFYITSRLFLYYHSLANSQVLKMPDNERTRIWFPLFSFFESDSTGPVPNVYENPFRLALSMIQTTSRHVSAYLRQNSVKRHVS